MINRIRKMFYDYFTDRGTACFENAFSYYTYFREGDAGFARGEVCFRMGMLFDSFADLLKSKGKSK